MGMPQKPNFSLIAQTSATVLFGDKQIGSVMKPFSNLAVVRHRSARGNRQAARNRTDFLTARTMSACI